MMNTDKKNGYFGLGTVLLFVLSSHMDLATV